MKIRNDEIVFSVVIPLYNKERYILNTLNSVFNQNYQNFEIIVINDGSTDNSLKTLKTISDKRLHCFTIKNSGVSVARNLGIKKSKGAFICLLDADDYWYPNHLDSFVKVIHEFPNEVVFCNNYETLLSKNIKRISKYSYLPLSSGYCIITDYFKSSLINSIAWTSAVCISNSVFKTSNYWFDENIASGQDTDLWVRLGLHFPFVFNKEITAIHNKNISDSLSKSNNYESRFLLTQKFLKQEKTNLSLKKFMDNNRFSVYVKCKYKGDTGKASILRSQIDKDNLNYKQKVIISLPGFVLKNLLTIKTFLVQKGWFDFSVFE